jgi:hypothetical protein
MHRMQRVGPGGVSVVRPKQARPQRVRGARSSRKAETTALLGTKPHDRCGRPYPWLAIWIRVPARVIEHRRGDRLHLNWLLREPHPQSAQPLVFGVHVIDGKRRVGDAIVDERRLERPRCGVPIRLEHQLDPVRLLGRDDGQPARLVPA